MQLLGSSRKDIDKNKDGEIVPRLETAEVVLVHCNLVNNNYQQASKILFTFVPNKKFDQLITITPHSLTMLKITNAEFSFIEIWFTDQINRPLEIEYNVNITLIIGIRKLVLRLGYSLESKCRKYVQGYGFLSFARKFEDKYCKKLMNTATKTGINAAKKFGGKFGKNFMDTAKKTGLHAAKTASKRVVQKTAEATGVLIGNKIADKITSLGKSKNEEKKDETNEVEEIYIPPERRQQIIEVNMVKILWILQKENRITCCKNCF